MTITDELIARIEAADEGSREMDSEIGVAVSDIDCWADDPGYIRIPGCGSISSRSIKVKHYTTSLDAALPGEKITKVEFSFAGCMWEVHQQSGPPHYETITVGYGNTEPLARRAAALKGLQAEPEHPCTPRGCP